MTHPSHKSHRQIFIKKGDYFLATKLMPFLTEEDIFINFKVFFMHPIIIDHLWSLWRYIQIRLEGTFVLFSPLYSSYKTNIFTKYSLLDFYLYNFGPKLYFLVLFCLLGSYWNVKAKYVLMRDCFVIYVLVSFEDKTLKRFEHRLDFCQVVSQTLKFYDIYNFPHIKCWSL